jgi:hypothetical protein
MHFCVIYACQAPNSQFFNKKQHNPMSPLIPPKESFCQGNLQCQVKSRNILVNKGLGPLKTPLKTETQVMIKHSFFQWISESLQTNILTTNSSNSKLESNSFQKIGFSNTLQLKHLGTKETNNSHELPAQLLVVYCNGCEGDLGSSTYWTLIQWTIYSLSWGGKMFGALFCSKILNPRQEI